MGDPPENPEDISSKPTAEGNAAKLKSAIPSIDGIRIATKEDLVDTTTTFKADVQHLNSVLRAKIEAEAAKLRAEIYRSLRINNLSLIGSFTAIASILVVLTPLLR